MIGPTDEVRTAAYRAARGWAVQHEHAPPDDRMLDAALTAAFAIVERDYEPRRCDEVSWTAHRCTKPRGHGGGHQHRWSGVVWP